MAEIQTTMTADTSQFEYSMKRAQRAAKSSSTGVQSSFGKLNTTMTSVVAGSAKMGGAMALAVVAFKSMIGNNVDQARYSFDQLSSAAKVSSDELLTAMRTAANGMVTDFELIQSASRGMVLGLQPDTLVKFMEIAAASSKATGQTMTQAFEDIVIGSARQSKLILDNLGIIIKLDDAYAAYAKTMGIAADDLTEAMKKQAFMNAVISAGEQQIKDLGSSTKGVLSENAQMLTTMGNAWDSFSTGILNALNSFSAVGNSVIELFRKISTKIKQVSQGASIFDSTNGVFGAEAVKYDTASTLGQQSTIPQGGLAGTGEKAMKAQAKEAKKMAAQIEKINLELNNQLDLIGEEDYNLRRTKAEQRRTKRLADVQGDYETTKKITEAYYAEIAQIDVDQAEEVALALNEIKKENLATDQQRELADLEEWKSTMMDLTINNEEQRLEVEAAYAERRAQIRAEGREAEIEASQGLYNTMGAMSERSAAFEVEVQKSKFGMLSQLGELAAKHGGSAGLAFFKVMQGIKAAEAVVNTHAAVMLTMATVPYPMNIPLAAAQAAIGAGQVASILSASPGSTSVGSVSSSSSTSTSDSSDLSDVSATETTDTEDKGNLSIVINGDIMNADYVDMLALKISEAVDERNVTLKSSQARTIA